MSRHPSLLCLPQTSPVVFFSFWKWIAQFFCDLSSKSLYQACWAANLSRQGELHSAGRENGLSVMRNGLYIFKTHQTGNYFQISFFHFKILNCINFYAWIICWILYWYTFIFKISLNVTRNFGIKNSLDRTDICKISYNFLTVATIWAVMLTKRIWAPKNPVRIRK